MYGDFEMVKFLVDKGANVGQRAIGRFFMPEDQKFGLTKTTNYIGTYVGTKICTCGKPKFAIRIAWVCRVGHKKGDCHLQSSASRAPTHMSFLFFVECSFSPGSLVCLSVRSVSAAGYAYYGEYPLAFASCFGREEIYDYLIDHGADPDAKDSFGNAILHMLVISNQLVSLMQDAISSSSCAVGL